MDYFISYSSDDTSVAEALENFLRGSGLIPIRDKSGLRFGDHWKDALFPKIRTCRVFLLIWSKSASKSIPVLEELLEAVKHNVRIIVLFLDDTPVPPIIADIHNNFSIESNQQTFDGLLEHLDIDADIDTASSMTVASAVSSYKRLVQAKFSNLQVLMKSIEKPINDSYLELKFTRGLDSKDTLSVLTTTEIGNRFFNQENDFVLAGPPGSGKTSTLHFFIHNWSIRTDKSLMLYAEIRKFDSRKYQELDDFLIDRMSVLRSSQGIQTAFTKYQIFDKRPCLILLDGLDEISPAMYGDFLNALNRFKSNYPQGNVVVTTRIDGFKAEKETDFAGWLKYTVVPLEEKKINEFVETWFKGKDRKAARLIERISKPRIKELAGRAFLLALICLVFEEDETKVSSNRSALYDQATKYLVRDRFDRYTHSVIENRHSLLRELALTFLQLSENELSVKLIQAIGENHLGDEFHEPIDDFLDKIVTETGVLQNYGGTYTFAHRSFQEYYAASALHEHPNGNKLIESYAQVAKWEEPIRLYAGLIREKKGQEDFIASLWRINPPLALRSIGECDKLGEGFLSSILNSKSVSTRVRMLQELSESLKLFDRNDALWLTVETLTPLLQHEQNSEVIYGAISLIEEFDPEDKGRLLYKNFKRFRQSLFNELVENSIYRFELISIEEGAFIMGDNNSANSIEKPEHEVFVSSFQISKFPLTNLAYEKIMGGDQSSRLLEVSELDDQPVVNLSWYDAFVCAYKVGCRLPTEAEWEYMARAGTSSDWCFGSNEEELTDYAVYVDNSGQRTLSVGSKEPNAWGIYDVHGNVWEWCSDWQGPYPNHRVEDPLGPEIGVAKIRRGGGHSYHAFGCRSAFRWGNDPDYKYKDIGVRLAITNS